MARKVEWKRDEVTEKGGMEMYERGVVGLLGFDDGRWSMVRSCEGLCMGRGRRVCDGVIRWDLMGTSE